MGDQKRETSDLAILGGPKLFDRPRSIGNLVKPSFERFLQYSKIFFDAHHYSNNGPVNQLLERRLAEFHQVDHCVTFSSAFWGLSLTIRALAIPGRSEVIMPSLTYRRMGEIAASAGLVPRFCDVEMASLSQRAENVRPCLSGETALIIGTHPTVNCCDAPGIVELGRDAGVPVMFDSVESVYETIGGQKVGSFGSAEGFSIHATKLINGFEGGYITTNSSDLAEHLRFARGFGFRSQDEVVTGGLNAKLNEMHAAMAMASMDDLEEQVERNRARYNEYRKGLQSVRGISVREFDESEKCSFKNIVAELHDDWPLKRSTTVEVLNAENALARPYYWPALHTKATRFETRAEELPVTDWLAERFLWLPCGNQMAVSDVGSMVELLSFVQRQGTEIEAALAG